MSVDCNNNWWEYKTFGRRRKKLDDFFLIRFGFSGRFGCDGIVDGPLFGSLISRIYIFSKRYQMN